MVVVWSSCVGSRSLKLAPAAGLAPVRTRLKGEALDSLHSRAEIGRSGRIRTCGIRRMKPAFCWAELRSEKEVLPPGFAPGPRPHLGLTAYKAAVLLYTTGGMTGRDRELHPVLPLTRRAHHWVCFRGKRVAPADGLAPSPSRLTGGRTTVIPRWCGGRRRACSPNRFRFAPLSRRSRRACPVRLPKLVAADGLAPSSPDPKSGVLLLDDTAKNCPRQELHLRPQGPQPCILSAELRGL